MWRQQWLNTSKYNNERINRIALRLRIYRKIKNYQYNGHKLLENISADECDIQAMMESKVREKIWNRENKNICVGTILIYIHFLQTWHYDI